MNTKYQDLGIALRRCVIAIIAILVGFGLVFIYGIGDGEIPMHPTTKDDPITLLMMHGACDKSPPHNTTITYLGGESINNPALINIHYACDDGIMRSIILPTR